MLCFYILFHYHVFYYNPFIDFFSQSKTAAFYFSFLKYAGRFRCLGAADSIGRISFRCSFPSETKGVFLYMFYL